MCFFSVPLFCVAKKPKLATIEEELLESSSSDISEVDEATEARLLDIEEDSSLQNDSPPEIPEHVTALETPASSSSSPLPSNNSSNIGHQSKEYPCVQVHRSKSEIYSRRTPSGQWIPICFLCGCDGHMHRDCPTKVPFVLPSPALFYLSSRRYQCAQCGEESGPDLKCLSCILGRKI